MSVVPRPPGDLNDALRALGAQIATSLVAKEAGHPGKHTGWRGALQDAADLTQNDPGVLTVADEIHQAAHDLTTPAGVHVYAESTLSTIVCGIPSPAPEFVIARFRIVDGSEDTVAHAR